MKKLLALLLILAMSLSLCACGIMDLIPNKYEDYENLIDLLENGNYEAAIREIEEMSREEDGDDMLQSTEPEAVTHPEYPSGEEEDLLREYYDIVSNLEAYLEYGSISIWGGGQSYDGSEALAYCCNRLQELESIDSWLAQPDYFLNRYGEALNQDRMDILSRFSILPDVKQHQTVTITDNMGNVRTGNGDYWEYASNGDVILHEQASNIDRVSHYSYSKPFTLVYNEQGQVVQKTYTEGYSDSIVAIVTYTYDENGFMVNEHLKTNYGDWDYAYSYDDQGRVSQIHWVESTWTDTPPATIDYIYDDAGRLVQEVKTQYSRWVFSEDDNPQYYANWKDVMTYVYDDAGVLVSGTYADQIWSYEGGFYSFEEYLLHERVDQYTYTCDDQGRVIKTTIIPGDDVYVAGDKTGEVYETPNYTEKIIETFYGDYYFYAAE